MKKICILLFSVFLTLLPLSSVMAADVDVLRGVTFVSKNNKVSGIQNITDGSDGTYAVWSGSDTLTYEFPQPVDIDYGAFYISAVNADVNIFDADGVKLMGGSFSTGSRQLAGMKNVKKVTIYGSVFSPGGATRFNYIRLYQYGVNPDVDKFVISNLAYVLNNAGNLSLSWDPIRSDYFGYYQIYKDGQPIGTVTQPLATIKDLVPGDTHQFTVSAFDKSGKEYGKTSFSYTVPIPDTTPPDKPVGFSVDPDVYYADLTWTKDTVPDLAGYYVYVNGNRVSALITEPSYKLTGLKPATEYKAYIIAADLSGNMSEKSDELVFKTQELVSVPESPVLSGTPYSGSVNLSWAPSKYAESYKIYKDGTMLLSTQKTFYRVSDLENARAYQFSVVAVNKVGDSSPSNLLTLIPDSKLMPDIGLGYGLKDVADGTSTWFSSYWLILAFTISIPLSFYVSNRIKGLFVS